MLSKSKTSTTITATLTTRNNSKASNPTTTALPEFCCRFPVCGRWVRWNLLRPRTLLERAWSVPASRNKTKQNKTKKESFLPKAMAVACARLCLRTTDVVCLPNYAESYRSSCTLYFHPLSVLFEFWGQFGQEFLAFLPKTILFLARISSRMLILWFRYRLLLLFGKMLARLSNSRTALKAVFVANLFMLNVFFLYEVAALRMKFVAIQAKEYRKNK